MKTDKEIKDLLFDTVLVMGVDFMEQPMRDFFEIGPDKEIADEEEWDRVYDIRKRMIVRSDPETYTIRVEFGPHDAETEAMLDAAEAVDNEVRERLGIEERKK